MSDNMLDYALQVAPPRLIQNKLGRDIVKYLFGLPSEVMYRVQKEAALSQEQVFNSPIDSEKLAAEERNLLTYEIDTRDTIRNRVDSVWVDKTNEGCENSIEKQFTAAGWPNSKVISTDLKGTTTYPFKSTQRGTGPLVTNNLTWQHYAPSTSYYSQFIVIVPVVDLSRFKQWFIVPTWDTPGVKWDTPGLYWNSVHSVLVSYNALTEMKTIVSTYKPVQWICTEIVLLYGSIAQEWNEGLYDSNPQAVLSLPYIERWNPTI